MKCSRFDFALRLNFIVLFFILFSSCILFNYYFLFFSFILFDYFLKICLMWFDENDECFLHKMNIFNN